MTITVSQPADREGLDTLYPAAFPDEDLLPLVRNLLDGRSDVISLVARRGTTLVGHVVFTDCAVDGSDARLSLLGPLGVLPSCQGEGIGTALVRDGLGRLARAGTDRVFVLGDPAYYGRFGFAPESSVTTPSPIPDDWSPAWQSLALSERPLALRGVLRVPPPWQPPSLWAS